KPNEQSQACLSYAMARKRDYKNVFVKPNEQSQACLGYAMARKRNYKNTKTRPLLSLPLFYSTQQCPTTN
ncbi:MAG: hypothetical protein ACI4TS_04565, partial [Bacteroidaceae bacterium]